MNWIRETLNEIKTSPKTVRDFGLILSGVLLLFPLLANVIGILFAHRSFHYWFGWPVLSVIALFVNFLVPAWMGVVYRIGMLLTRPVSWVVTNLVLGILFYFLLAPMSMAMRILGKDLLDERIDRPRQSYWIKRAGKKEAESYEHLF